MGRKLTQEEAVQRMRDALPKYTYEKFTYQGSSKKSVVTCDIHGDFAASYDGIVGGHGCPKCKADAVGRSCRNTHDDAVAAMRTAAPDYDYSRFVYKDSNTKGIVVCQKHGEFLASHHSVISGRKCSRCSVEHRSVGRRLDADEALSRMRAAAPQYDYSRFIYRMSTSTGVVVCPHHGEFMTSYTNIVNGVGCKKCAFNAISVANTIPFHVFVTRANAVHAGKYSYIEESYTGVSGYIEANCPEHGPFRVLCYEHFCGQSCPDCKDTRFNPKKRAYLYIYKLSKDGVNYVGYGITKNVYQRDATHQRRLKRHGITGVILHKFRFKSGYICRDVETSITAMFGNVNLGVPGFKKEASDWENYEKILQEVALAHHLHGKKTLFL